MLQVRNLPDDVHAKLKQRARDARMSLSDYVAEELTSLVATKSNHEIFEWAAKLPESKLVANDIVRAVHAEREYRE